MPEFNKEEYWKNKPLNVGRVRNRVRRENNVHDKHIVDTDRRWVSPKKRPELYEQLSKETK